MNPTPFEPPATGEPDDLAEFAGELRSALPDPPFRAEFAARLAEMGSATWSVGISLRRNPVLRAAAFLLILTVSAVPVTALVQLLAWPRSDPPILHFEAPLPRPEHQGDPGLLRAVPPPIPEPRLVEETWNEDWARAVEGENRRKQAVLSWQARFPLPRNRRPLVSLPSGGLPSGARRGLEIRLGLRTASRAPWITDWKAASAPDLWGELQRRLALGENEAPRAALAARVRDLWNRRAPGDRGWLGGWIALLDGPGDSESLPLPAAGGEAWRVFWEAVPWRPPFLSPPGSSATLR